MQTNTTDAVVVGAGPVGLTMAAALMHHGLKCRIVEKVAAPTDKSKALVVWSRTLELLEGLGLATDFVNTGRKVRWASIYGGGERLVHVELAGVDSPYDFPLMIPQNETERLLNDHLEQKGLKVERQVELVSFTEHPESVKGTLRHTDGTEQEFETSWLIGCDGAHSTVRHTLGIEFTGSAEPNDWMLADIIVEGSLATDAVTVFWHEKGILVFFPITEVRFRVIADLGLSVKGGLLPNPTLAEIQTKVDERGPGGIVLKDPVWLSNFRINERKVSEYYRGRVMLAGDAAHIHSPAGGQGMNTGMQDAFNLAWKLVLIQHGQGQAKPLLDSYTLERSAIGDQVLKGAGMVTLMATLRNPVAQYFRNHVASVMSSFHFVQDKLRNAASELAINYRHSPLSVQNVKWLKGGIHAGDRLPDAKLSDEKGEKTTLFAVLKGMRHSLLLFPHSQQSLLQLSQLAAEVMSQYPDVISSHIFQQVTTDVSEPSQVISNIACWHDEGDLLRKKLGLATDASIFVRPDGYIGYRCDRVDAEAFKKYLGTYLMPTN